jgi:hypothetical protein
MLPHFVPFATSKQECTLYSCSTYDLGCHRKLAIDQVVWLVVLLLSGSDFDHLCEYWLGTVICEQNNDAFRCKTLE